MMMTTTVMTTTMAKMTIMIKSMMMMMMMMIMIMITIMVTDKIRHWNIVNDDANNERRKEGNVLFLRRTQHILFTVIWRQTYDKRPLRWRERGNPLLIMGYSFQLAAMIVLYALFYRQDSTFVTPVVEH